MPWLPLFRTDKIPGLFPDFSSLLKIPRLEKCVPVFLGCPVGLGTTRYKYTDNYCSEILWWWFNIRKPNACQKANVHSLNVTHKFKNINSHTTFPLNEISWSVILRLTATYSSCWQYNYTAPYDRHGWPRGFHVHYIHHTLWLQTWDYGIFTANSMRPSKTTNFLHWLDMDPGSHTFTDFVYENNWNVTTIYGYKEMKAKNWPHFVVFMNSRASSNRNGQKNRKIGIHAPKT